MKRKSDPNYVNRRRRREIFTLRSREERHQANLSLMREGIVRWNLQHDTNCPDGDGLARYLVRLFEDTHRL